jgi:hypothetical protein
MRRSASSRALGLIGGLLALAACGPVGAIAGGDTGGGAVPFVPPPGFGPTSNLVIGQLAAVVASSLNLRDSIGVGGSVVAVMPCGSLVQVYAGPSTSPVTGWWKIGYNDPQNNSFAGWAAGNYLTDAANFDASVCGQLGGPVLDFSTVADLSGDFAGVDFSGVDFSTPTVDMAQPIVPMNTLQDAIIQRAQEGVGYSYWWGHGAWSDDGANPGTCSGSCPSCTHGGSYGADCSGFVAKVWQVPSASSLEIDEHPYSTQNFYNDQTYWTQIDRSSVQQADAMVHWNGSEGHVALFDTGDDPFGSIWIYEAYGCATGIIHDMRTLDSSYRAIRLSAQ